MSTASLRPDTRAAASARPDGGWRSAVSRHPAAAYFVAAYAISWACWAPAVVTGVDAIEGPVALLIYVGVWGPAAAAALVTWATGASVREWFRGLFRWRVGRRWYLYAVGLPVAFVAVVSAIFVLLDGDLDSSLLGERLVAFLPAVLVLSLVGGGNEELGWRGFALPRLLERWTPVRATLVLGVLWATWHLPLLLAQDDLSHGLSGPALAGVLAATALAIVGYAFAYTFLYQRTRSVLLCVLLHGSINAANGTLVLRTEIEGTAYATMQYVITAVLAVAVVALIWATRGRLGAPPASAPGSAPDVVDDHPVVDLTADPDAQAHRLHLVPVDASDR